MTLARHAREDELVLRTALGDRPARVAGRDAAADLAVLRVEDAPPPLAWTEGPPPRIGTPVVALADPGGRGLRATAGTLSAAPRAVRGPSGRLIEGALEHTAPLPRGSGGGPLTDLDGAVLGLNALRQGEGLLVAWPAALLRERAEAILGGHAASPPALGLALAGPGQTRRLRAAVGLEPVDGLLVRGVRDGGPAAVAGLARGDVLVEAGGVALADVDALYGVLDRAPSSLTLGVLRGTERLEVEVRL